MIGVLSTIIEEGQTSFFDDVIFRFSYFSRDSYASDRLTRVGLGIRFVPKGAFQTFPTTVDLGLNVERSRLTKRLLGRRCSTLHESVGEV